jgi:anti-sigma factor RsiW
MTHYRTQPPWEFLLSASRNSLQSYELTRLSHAANLRKEISVLLDQWLEENTAAMLARWLMEQRERPAQVADSQAGSEHGRNGAHPVSDNFFADQAVPPRTSRGPV